MRITVPEIDCSKGFTATNDIFERAKLSKRLENIFLNSEDENLVIAINDIWGNGKTSFLKMWESELRENGQFQVVYFDAFKNDFQSDPFMAIASHIYTTLEEKETKEKYLKATKEVAKTILKASLKVGISALTLGTVKGTELEDIGDDLKSAITDPIDDYITNKITDLENEIKSVAHFRKVLSEIGEKKKLIFIIDELDRARPIYSLELLEKIKHVFNTANIYFVLAFDKEQFKHVIRKSYGEIDADIYLNKFVHLWFNLPIKGTPETKHPTLIKYVDYINKKILEQDNKLNTSVSILSALLHINNLSLRDAERCYSMLLVANAQQENGFEWQYQVGFAIISFLKLKNESVIKRIYNKTISLDDLQKELGIKGIKTKAIGLIDMAIKTEYMSDDEFTKAVQEQTTSFKNLWNDQLKTLSFAIERMYDIEL